LSALSISFSYHVLENSCHFDVLYSEVDADEGWIECSDMFPGQSHHSVETQTKIFYVSKEVTLM